MKRLVFGFMLCLSAHSYGQDLISRQAPIDRKMKSTSTISSYDKDTNPETDSIKWIDGTLIVENNEGWEWIQNEKGEYEEEFYPIPIEYYKYSSHPQYKVIRQSVYDNNGKLVRFTIYFDYLMLKITDELMRLSCITDYRNNKYNFKREDQKAQNYVKKHLGLISSKTYCPWNDAAIRYLTQLESDHGTDFSYLLKIERLDNCSFKLFFGTQDKITTSTWKLSFSTYEKYNSIFKLTKLQTEQIDWSLYDKTSDKKSFETKATQPDSQNDEPESMSSKGDDKDIDYDKVFDVVDEMPQFPGGAAALFDYLSHSICYPKKAEENGIQGRVIVTYVVERDGSISDVKVVHSVDPSLDKEAVRVTESMPKWIPGKHHGRATRVKYTIPVTFKLQ